MFRCCCSLGIGVIALIGLIALGVYYCYNLPTHTSLEYARNAELRNEMAIITEYSWEEKTKDKIFLQGDYPLQIKKAYGLPVVWGGVEKETEVNVIGRYYENDKEFRAYLIYEPFDWWEDELQM